jgi:DNA-binding MarR family transcriptional regulator
VKNARKSNKQLVNKVRSHLDNEHVSLGRTKRKILFLLNKKPDYAYSLHKRLLNGKDLEKKTTMDISTLYQHLNELEKLGRLYGTRLRALEVKLYASIIR